MPKKNIILFSIIIISVLTVAVSRFFSVLSETTRPVFQETFIVRVCLARDTGSLKFEVKYGCDIFNAETGNFITRKTGITSGAKIVPVPEGIKIGNTVCPAERVRLVPLRGADSRGNFSKAEPPYPELSAFCRAKSSDKDGSASGGREAFNLNGTFYRGQVDIIRTSEGLTAVNRVDLEDYLKGVIPREVHSFWPFAAIEAQAIVSRSFAVYKSLRREDKDYDLTDDTFSQVYGGFSGENHRTTHAVEATRGKVLEYKGKVLPAYFHSCCGGCTQSISREWGQAGTEAGFAPLEGVKCSLCRWTPYFRWHARIAEQDIVERLGKKGYDLGYIDNIIEGPRDVSRRLEYVKVRSHDKWIEIGTGDFRSAIGRRVLKSANFTVKKHGKSYIFKGYGWGHGVGMCQWGAFGLAFKRWNAEKILAKYYPGSSLTDLGRLLPGENNKRNNEAQ